MPNIGISGNEQLHLPKTNNTQTTDLLVIDYRCPAATATKRRSQTNQLSSIRRKTIGLTLGLGQNDKNDIVNSIEKTKAIEFQKERTIELSNTYDRARCYKNGHKLSKKTAKRTLY